MSRKLEPQSFAESSPPLADDQYPSGIGSRIAEAIYMLDATIGIGNALVILVVLIVAGDLLSLILPRMLVRPFTEEDRAALQRQLEWPVYIEESFDNEQIHDSDSDADWGLGYEYHDDYDFYRELVEGKYSWWVDFYTTECCVDAKWMITRQPVEDFVLSTDFQKYEGGEGPTYGVVFHYQDEDNYYTLDYNDIGNLSVEIVYQGEWAVIFTTHSQVKRAIQPFEANRLVLSVENGQGLILINDQYIGQFHDTRIPQGHLGFIVGSPYNRTGTVVIDIDNITLRIPD